MLSLTTMDKNGNIADKTTLRSQLRQLKSVGVAGGACETNNNIEDFYGIKSTCITTSSTLTCPLYLTTYVT